MVYLLNVSVCLFSQSASAFKWVNQAHGDQLLFPACQSSAAAAARGRSPFPPLHLQAEWEMASTPPRLPAPTPAPAALGNGGACSARRLSASQVNGTAIHVSSLSTSTSHRR